MRRLIPILFLALLWALPVSAQVDCGNGKVCPADHACLLNDLCGRIIDVPPGAVKMSNGNFCDPGYTEAKNVPGRCVPPGYTECSNGLACPPGEYCTEGGCGGGVEPTGPMCNGRRCAAGRICSSTGNCMNTALFQDCGNGTICSKHAACEMGGGCIYAAPERVPQRLKR